MPSPGAGVIVEKIGVKKYTVEGGFSVEFSESGEFVLKLANAMNAGWTSSSPFLSTSMSIAFNKEFAGYLAGQGAVFVNCIARGIDQETAIWVASWDARAQVHRYIVNAGSITGRIMGCSPVRSNGARALAEVGAGVFVGGFGQEVG